MSKIIFKDQNQSCGFIRMITKQFPGVTHCWHHPTGQGCAGVVRDCDDLQAWGDLVWWRHLLEQHRLPRLALQRQVSQCPSKPLLLHSSWHPCHCSSGVKFAMVNIISFFVFSLTMFCLKCQLSPTLLPNFIAGANCCQSKCIQVDTCAHNTYTEAILDEFICSEIRNMCD